LYHWFEKWHGIIPRAVISESGDCTTKKRGGSAEPVGILGDKYIKLRKEDLQGLLASLSTSTGSHSRNIHSTLYNCTAAQPCH